jgi:hypothetical protein
MSERTRSTPETIEQRAYELYLERGGADGDDLTDWLTAERELAVLPEQSDSSAPKAPSAIVDPQATPPKGGRAALEVPVEYSNR